MDTAEHAYTQRNTNLKTKITTDKTDNLIKLPLHPCDGRSASCGPTHLRVLSVGRGMEARKEAGAGRSPCAHPARHVPACT